jgi:aminotransferase
MSIECDKAGGINLSQGICDMEVPYVVKRGAHEAIEKGFNYYTRYDGIYELKKAIAKKYRIIYGVDINPDNEVIVSAGSTGALFCVCLALFDPGDEIILFEPFYGYHYQTLIATQLNPVFVRTNPPEWEFDFHEIISKISTRTRGILINTPANPSGKVFTLSELEYLSRVAKEFNLFVVTDEIYEHFVYDGRKQITPFALPGMRERTIIVSGVSKTFSVTGWRIGYTISDKRWTQSIGYFNDLLYVCAPSPLQYGVASGLNQVETDYYEKIGQIFQKKRDLICDALVYAGLNPYIPHGAYYVLADISKLPGSNSKEKAIYLLNEIGVACVPGKSFYHDDSGENMARFCFAKEDNILIEARNRLKRLRIKFT